MPYGGDEWLEHIQWLVEACERRGLKAWLYDEGPFPSGVAGWRLMAEHSEFAAHEIVQQMADPELKPGDHFRFPIGQLLWCGIVGGAEGRTVDLTARVGVLQEQWNVLDPWDSRYYYPDTPRYACPRAMTRGETYAVRVPDMAEGQRLVAYLAETRRDEEGHWRWLPDSLNPDAARRFIEMTHERYHDRLGDRFGQTITAVFAEEPKVHVARPWTPGIFEAFQRDFGYDLRPRLWRLFDDSDEPDARLIRLHYRQ